MHTGCVYTETQDARAVRWSVWSPDGIKVRNVSLRFSKLCLEAQTKDYLFPTQMEKKLQDVSWHQTSSHPCDQNKRKVFVYISTLLYGGNELYQPMSQRQSSQNKKSDMSQAVLFSSHMTVYYKAALVDFFVDSLGRRNIYSNQ